MKSCAVRYISKVPGQAGQQRWIFSDSPRPVLDLIEWVYWKHNEVARLILREKIMVSETPSVFDAGLIKTAAKRWELLSSTALHEVERVDVQALEKHRSAWVRQGIEKYSSFLHNNFKSLQEAVQWVREEEHALVDEAQKTGIKERYRRDRPVIAALFDSHWKMLGAAKNTNGVIRTRHAEMNLIEHLNGRGHAVTDGTMIVSLQCCRMCAAALVDNFPKLQVIYIEPETALANVRTALFGKEQQI